MKTKLLTIFALTCCFVFGINFKAEAGHHHGHHHHHHHSRSSVSFNFGQPSYTPVIVQPPVVVQQPVYVSSPYYYETYYAPSYVYPAVSSNFSISLGW